MAGLKSRGEIVIVVVGIDRMRGDIELARISGQHPHDPEQCCSRATRTISVCVKDRDPYGRRRALRAAPGRLFGAVGPDPAPFARGDVQISLNQLVPNNRNAMPKIRDGF